MSLTLIRGVSSVMVYAQCATSWQFVTKLLINEESVPGRFANFSVCEKKWSNLGE
jgi:hypothetical protein